MRGWNRVRLIGLVALWVGLLVMPNAVYGSEAGWQADELNWQGISQRRINEVRRDAGLVALVTDGYLRSLALERARDMAERGYLSRQTPEGLDAGSYMAKDGARYERWVELNADDLSGDSEADVSWRVIDRLLNDPAARATLLGDYDRLGVASAERGSRRVFVVLIARAAPAPAPTSDLSLATIVEVITATANRYGVDPNRLVRVARCESGLNPRAYNPAGPYIGLFQFHPNTFAANGGKDIYSPHDQSEIAAKMFAQGLAWHWGCK